ncbi:hypothetical protein [Pelosinus sp. UFO1]|uniref:hypothetical protein n=1 Tax=Pelosinus sp. UFO1 TaxID=484770 RepID=UPI0004D14DFF|nr:hypothetical protein [Pelosinus sp. UFO1]AIF52212.1 hypothetical protein UFO1_2669 [Pelosinus sp. UFO1]
MDIKNLYVVVVRDDKQEKIKIEEYRKNNSTGHNEVLFTLDNQKAWVDAYDVLLYKDLGSVFCWKDYNEGKYIVLNESNSICPRCGWWICHHCGACYCNKS